LKLNYVLIDYENVQVKSLALLKGEQFRVRIFLGPNNKKLPVELVLAMQGLGNYAEYIVLKTPGVNALDFHIAYYLGVLATADPSGFFHIISKDTGFDSLMKHMKAKKVFSLRSTSIEEMPCFASKVPNGNNSKIEPVEKKAESIPVQSSLERLVQVAVGDLIKRKASKPRTPKTLLSTIHAKCGKETPIPDIKTVFEELMKRGYVKVDGEKVSYSLPVS